MPAADGRVQLGHQFGRRETWHSAQRKTAKQNYGGIIIFDLFIRAFSLSSRNFGFVDQGYDWKTIGMTSLYYSGFGAWGHAADIRAAEVPTDCTLCSNLGEIEVAKSRPLKVRHRFFRGHPSWMSP